MSALVSESERARDRDRERSRAELGRTMCTLCETMRAGQVPLQLELQLLLEGKDEP